MVTLGDEFYFDCVAYNDLERSSEYVCTFFLPFFAFFLRHFKFEFELEDGGVRSAV